MERFFEMGRTGKIDEAKMIENINDLVRVRDFGRAEEKPDEPDPPSSQLEPKEKIEEILVAPAQATRELVRQEAYLRSKEQTRQRLRGSFLAEYL